MKRIILVLLMVMPFVVFAQDFVRSTPSWYKNPPTAKGKYYGVGSASSTDIRTAEDKALHLAKVQIAKQIDGAKRVATDEDNNKSTKNDNGPAESFNVELKEVKLVNKAFRKKKGKYIAYVLLELDKKKQD